ncbi:MAG TPA: amidohydrolase/deacetylase family metallohydrolase [Chloroflexota bacterium]|nr:amidohydrolase/deacetylase family metallohydrolase [Chloroflexota bacterium]
MRFEAVIKGGRVLDPGARLDGVLDVAIDGGRISAVEAGIPAEAAARTIDASGLLVTPGLVDLHTHIYPGATYWGIRPDPVAAVSGVTTWVDAGSAGAMNVLGMRQYLERTSRVGAYAFLNISTIGLTPATYELTNLELVDVALCVKMARLNADFVRGVKIRMGAQTVGENGLEPLRRGIRAAEELGLPAMVHISTGPPEIDEIVAELRPGDLLTHSFTGGGMRLVKEDGAPREAIRRALDSGLLLDMGHGAGGFSFEVAEQLAAHGIRPDVVSTDLHQSSLWGPVYDLPTCIEKAMVLGLSLEEAIERSTAAPARVLRLEGQVGTLRPGARADVALFRLDQAPKELVDTRRVKRTSPVRLTSVLTLVGGRALPAEAPNERAPWMAKG